MKSHLMQQLEDAPVAARENLAREYLQVYLLRLLHERGAMEHLAFVGGTALRLLYGLPRFSEDLDFSAHGTEALEPKRLFRGVTADLEAAGYRVTARGRQHNHVAQCGFRFDGLPAEGGWRTDPRVGLRIRVEADLRPPAGARVETTLIQRFYPIALRHYDLPSLFAGKLHALLARPWPKGRDWYDLVWYLTEQRGLEPNYTLLGNALEQTGHPPVGGHWRGAVRETLHRIDWPAVLSDVRPFVERSSDLEHLSPEAIDKLLER